MRLCVYAFMRFCFYSFMLVWLQWQSDFWLQWQSDFWLQWQSDFWFQWQACQLVHILIRILIRILILSSLLFSCLVTYNCCSTQQGGFVLWVDVIGRFSRGLSDCRELEAGVSFNTSFRYVLGQMLVFPVEKACSNNAKMLIRVLSPYICLNDSDTCPLSDGHLRCFSLGSPDYFIFMTLYSHKVPEHYVFVFMLPIYSHLTSFPPYCLCI